MEKLEQQIEKLAIAVANGFEAVDKQFNEVNQRFDDVNHQLSDVRQDIRDVRRDIRIRELKEISIPLNEYQDVLRRLSSLEEKMSKVEAKS